MDKVRSFSLRIIRHLVPPRLRRHLDLQRARHDRALSSDQIQIKSLVFHPPELIFGTLRIVTINRNYNFAHHMQVKTHNGKSHY